MLLALQARRVVLELQGLQGLKVNKVVRGLREQPVLTV